MREQTIDQTPRCESGVAFELLSTHHHDSKAIECSSPTAYGRGSVFLAAMLWANSITSAEPVRKNPDNHESLSKIVESLKAAWNKNDADRIAELFLPDAILVLPTGSAAQSRSEIKQRVLAEWRGKLKDTQLSYAVEDVSLLNNDTAVVTGKYRLNGMKILGFDKAPEGPFVFRHKKQHGRWMISKAEIFRHKVE
jgi:uncharacterized protein (TIGR02246 family)